MRWSGDAAKVAHDCLFGGIAESRMTAWLQKINHLHM